MSSDEPKRVDISIRRVSEEIWIEFYQAGLRVRFEQTRQEIVDLAAICQRLVDNWDADTLALEEKLRSRYEQIERESTERSQAIVESIKRQYDARG